MGRSLLGLAVVLALLLASSAPLLPRASSGSGGEEGWHIIVMPFFMQERLGDDMQMVFLYAYSSIEAVIDLNYNGVPDPGEPVINVTSEGRRLIVPIGYSSSAYKPAVGFKWGSGPLWILTRKPLLAGMLVRDGGVYKGAYYMPPPGRVFTLPGIPGDVYVTPATPEGATVRVAPGGATYKLSAGEVLVIPVGDKPGSIVADKPVAAVLVGHAGRALYMTELVPWEGPALLHEAPLPPSPGALEGSWLSSSRFYVAIVSREGVSWVERHGQATLHDYMGGAPAIVYLVQMVSGGIGVAPIYNPAFWSYYFGGADYWLTTYGLKADSGTKTALELIPLYEGETPWAFVRLARLTNGVALREAVLYLKSHSVVPLTPHGGYRVVRVYSNTAVTPIVYYKNSYGNSGDLILRAGAIPVPSEYSSYIVDHEVYPDYAFYAPVDPLSPDAISSLVYQSGIAVPSGAEKANATFSVHASMQGPCEASGILAALTGPLMGDVLEWNVSLGCEFRGLWRVEASPGEYFILLHAWRGSTIYPPLALPVTVAHKYLDSFDRPAWPEVSHKYPEPTVIEPQAKVAGTSSHIIKSESPQANSDFNRYLMKLNVNFRWPPSGAGSTTTSTTPPETTTTGGGEETTPPPQTTTPTTTTTKPATHSPAGTTTTTTAAGASATATTPVLGPLRAGDSLTYEFKAGGEGVEKGEWEGTVRLVVTDDGKLNVTENTLPADARELLLSLTSVSELMVYAAAEPGYAATPSMLASFYQSKCPAISPSRGDGSYKGTASMAGLIDVNYECRYSSGVLSYLKVEGEGDVQGVHVKVWVEARLVGSSVEGLGGGGGGLPAKLLVAAGVGLVAVVLVVFLVRRLGG